MGATVISIRRTRALLLLVPVGLVAALTLSACGKSGAASIVNGHTITVDQLQKATASLHAADPTSFGKVTDAQVLSALVLEPFAATAASASGNGVSDDEVRQEVASELQQSGDTGVHIDRLDTLAVQALKATIVLGKLDATTQGQVVKDLLAAKIEISPRYGTFDRTTGTITAAAPNWFKAKPAPKATATATATPSASG